MNDFSNKKIAVLGGTFNPIHIGHLIAGFEVLEKLSYDYILFIPTNIPVHKNFNNSSMPSDRLKMIESAISGIDQFLVSDIEIQRGGLTYTIDTIRELQKKYHCVNKFGFVIGNDLIDELYLWKEIDVLVTLVDFICLHRNDLFAQTQYEVRWIENRVVDISSTIIRERVKKGLPVNFMVPDNVNEYIIQNNLYKG